jgi:hypothetical protein
MAADLTLKSVAITNREATPRVLNNPGVGGKGVNKVVKSYLASVTAALSITSIIRMVEVPAHSYLTDLRFQSAAQAAGALDIGLYRTNADGGAVVDQDFFASGVVVTNAVVITDVMNESTTFTIAKQHQPLWQAVGMTEPPKGTMLDICLVVVTTDVTTGTGAVALQASYIE